MKDYNLVHWMIDRQDAIEAADNLRKQGYDVVIKESIKHRMPAWQIWRKENNMINRGDKNDTI